MTSHRIHAALRTLAGCTLLGAWLAGCGRTPQPEPVPPPPEAPAPTAPTDAPAQGAPASPEAPPDASPAAPAQPAPAAPPPTEPSPVPKPTAGAPALDSMRLAQASAKMGVAVDLRYSIDGAAVSGAPVTLHLAAIPQVEATRIDVSVKPEPGIELAAGPLTLQKSAGASVFRRQYSVTRGANAPAALRVLVTMDMREGSAFGYFTVPLDGGTSAQNKQESVKQR